MRRRLLIAAFAAVFLDVGSARAHDLRAGLFELRALGGDRYAATFKVSTPAGSTALGVSPQMPSRCRELTPRATSLVPRGILVRWMVHCPGGLIGAEIGARWGSSEADVLLRIEGMSGSPVTAVLTRDAPRFVVPAPGERSRMEVFADYLSLGVEHIALGYDHLLFVVEHIALGYDHLLFVLCLLLVCRRLRASVLVAVTAFTVGHSISLCLVTLGVIGVPVPPIEAAIAASVAFLAASLARPEADMKLTRPWLFAAIFGVLHGFGFAGALVDVGLPAGEIPAALIAFNAGVELGQLAFVAVVMGMVWLLERMRVPVLRWRVVPYGIGTVAMFWFVQRVASFWSGGLS